MRQNITPIRFLRKAVPFALCAVVAGMASAAGQAFHVISYMSKYDGPRGLIEGSPGVLYSESGSSNEATLSITTQGSKTILSSFPIGYQIPGLLVSGANGRFYSSVQVDLNPVRVFSVTSAAGSVQFYSPQNLDPILTQNLPDATLLGLAKGVSSYLWNLVTVGLDGTVTSIYQFPSTDLPVAAIYAHDGNYYGVSQATNASTGYVFRVTPSGSFTTVYNFPANTFTGQFAEPLLQATDGNLYGATATGGSNGTGTIYKLTLDGQYTLLHNFPKYTDSNPTALIEGSDGNLYGATAANTKAGSSSNLFRITRAGQYSLLSGVNFGTGIACPCDLVLGSDGIIYGAAPYAGGGGLYFAMDAGLPKPKPQAQHFHPQSGPMGTPVRIWGYNLLSASVEFNGVPATTVVNSGSNYVWATVPAGATTGPITITTPGGSVTTHATFTVQ